MIKKSFIIIIKLLYYYNVVKICEPSSRPNSLEMDEHFVQSNTKMSCPSRFISVNPSKFPIPFEITNGEPF